MYQYSEVKSEIFTEKGQVVFLKIRDHAKKLLEQAGACTMGAIMRGQGITGDTWVQMACVDRLVELGEIKEIQQTREVAGQHRVFVPTSY